jgi:hypothetical protein
MSQRRGGAVILWAQRPEGDLAAIVEAGIDLLIAKVEKERFAVTERPRVSRRAAGERVPVAAGERVTAAARREVYVRDGKRCTFVGADGRPWTETAFLEIDHVLERGRGGGPEAANLRLRCGAHNRYTAEQTFGREHIEAARAQAQAEREAAAQRRAVFNDTERALTGLGFSSKDARRATACAASSLDLGAALEDTIRAALRVLVPVGRAMS